jgi:YVTN family beta-propeller protein
MIHLVHLLTPRKAAVVLVASIFLVMVAQERSEFAPSLFLMSRMSVAEAREIPRIGVPGRPERLVYDGGSRLYVLDGQANQLHVVDLDDPKVVATVPVGLKPGSVRLVNGGSAIYVLNSQSLSISVLEPNTLSLIGMIDLAPWVESVPAEAGALMVNDAESQVLVNSRSSFLLDDGRRYNFYGSILTVDTGTNTVTKSLPILGSPYGSYETATYGGGLVSGFEGTLIYYRGSESGIFYSPELGSGRMVSSKLVPRPECAAIDATRSSVLVYANMHLTSEPITRDAGDPFLGAETRQVIDLRGNDKSGSRSEFCRLLIDDSLSIAYLLDARRSRLITIDLLSFQSVAIQRFNSQPSDMAVLQARNQLAVTFPDTGEIGLYPAFQR